MNDEVESVGIDTYDESIQAYVMSDGNIIDAIQKNQKVKRGRPSKKSQSNIIDEEIDNFGECYSSGSVYRPPLVFKNLKVFSIENPYHEQCMNVICDDCFTDYEIVPVDKRGLPINTDNKKLTRSDKILYDFFDSCNSDFLQMCKDYLLDFQNFSFANLELVRNRKGEPSKLNHMPSEYLRIARKLSEQIDTDGKYMLQIVNTHERIFKVFDENAPTYLEPHTSNPMTEVLYLNSYSPNGGKYGIPGWVPAIKSLVGMDKVAEYNINFFNNEAVPRFAVICEGGKLDEATKKTIATYFKKDLKGSANAHKTLVLSTPKGCTVTLKPLAVDIKDGSFKIYRKDCRDEIISAHRVPPHRLQIIDTGSSGSLSPGTLFELNKVYKYSVVEPFQKKVANKLNELIRYGFGITDRIIQFKPLDIGEEKERADTMRIVAAAHEKYYATGILTADEIRKELKYQPYSELSVDAEVKEWSSTPRPIYLIRQAQKEMEQQQGLGTNINGQNLNETPNEHDDKSREQTGDTQFTDEQVKQVTMKSNTPIIKVLQQLNQELEKSISNGLQVTPKEG